MRPSCTHRRWLFKQVMRFALSRVHALAGRSERRSGLRVLCYHRIREARRDPLSVSPEAFDRQMAWLAEQGGAIGLTALEEHLGKGSPTAQGATLVTIDDGFEDTWTHAAPVLRRYGIPAVAFVSVTMVGSHAGGPANDLAAASRAARIRYHRRFSRDGPHPGREPRSRCSMVADSGIPSKTGGHSRHTGVCLRISLWNEGNL